ncbi:outer membrane lipoprotein carrier protein LolA [Parvularcula sp. LCG005]|uniref:LolA family protein n=1 Tax=Parvularcula sp. LCG005 TaxID=3078805 RepID=UPI002942AD5E|nr:outer membrane lipoprotein carrier protein LolA [Parvularcula sp. LCG005]WOI53393.1 outer membrane lipoprotein carrier protein LolA [Parvularcula sp. LCG005]
MSVLFASIAFVFAQEVTVPQTAVAPPPPQVRAEQAPMDGPVAFADLTDEQVFEKAADALENIKSMRATFVQFSPSGAEMTGTVSLSRPGRLRFDYDEPVPQLIVATGGIVYVHDSELETTDTYPVGETPLQFLLSKRISRDEARVTNIFRSEDGVAVMLQSRDEELQGELGLVFGAPDMTLKEWAVFEPTGDVTRVALKDVEMDVRLPGRLFRAPDAGGTFLRDN